MYFFTLKKRLSLKTFHADPLEASSPSKKFCLMEFKDKNM